MWTAPKTMSSFNMRYKGFIATYFFLQHFSSFNLATEGPYWEQYLMLKPHLAPICSSIWQRGGSPLALEPDPGPVQVPGSGPACGYGSHHWTVAPKSLSAVSRAVPPATGHSPDLALSSVCKADSHPVSAHGHVLPGVDGRDCVNKEGGEGALQGAYLQVGRALSQQGPKF